jgi:hypothetical protein
MMTRDSVQGDSGMSSDTTKMVEHTVNQHMDHFGESIAPNVTFKKPSLTNLGCYRDYKVRGEIKGDRRYSGLTAISRVNGRAIKEPTISMDCVYLDFGDKISKTQTKAKNYGQTWMNMYIPKEAMSQLTEVL